MTRGYPIPKQKESVKETGVLEVKRRPVFSRKKDIKQTEAIIRDLNEKQKAFCREYIVDWNAVRSYMKVYGTSYNVSGVNGHQLLKNPKIKEYIEYCKTHLEEMAGISKLKILQEHLKLAFGNISRLHNTWIERKEFDKLTEEEKSFIQEISTQIKTTRNTDGFLEENEYIKIKLYDKQRSLDSVSKLLGYDAPQKIDNVVTFTGDPFKQIRENNGIN